jgi:tetratricopeptide (TPR) repeat protein
MARVVEMLQAGVRHHQAGELQKAELLYRQALHADPRQSDALHLLGVLAHQVGKNDLAVQYITQAISLSSQALYHVNLARALQGLGQLDEAESCCREAIRLQPDSPEIYIIQGNLLQGRDKQAQAETAFRQAIRLRPNYAEAHNNLGNVQRKLGKLAEAESSYREAMRLLPGNLTAITNLGAVLGDQGRVDEAEACHRESVRLRPDYAEGHHHLGLILNRRGRLADAAACFQEAVRLKPNYQEAHFCLGNVRSAQSRLEEAEVCYKEALRLRGDHPDALFNLGNVLQDRNKPAEAEACYRQALRFRPNSAEIHNNLGNTVRAQERVDEAMACFREALRLRPNFADVHSNLGNAYRDKADIPAAEAAYAEAVRLKPDLHAARNNQGACCIELGRTKDAIDLFHEILRLNPNFAPSLANLGTLARDGFYRFSDDEIARVRTLLAGNTLSTTDRSGLNFALANVLDKQLKAHDEAFLYYQQANDCRRQLFEERGQAFRPDAHRRYLDTVIATTTPELFQRTASFGVPSELPVFVLGMPRSGTSLVEQILASHPQIHGAGELHDVPRIGPRLAALQGKGDDPSFLARVEAADIRAAAAVHLARLAQLGGTAVRVIDKLPANVFHLGLIAVLFPRARVIHCLRDTIDVCVSCFFQDFHTLSFATRLEDVGFYYKEYERVAAHWRNVMPLPVMEVRYEEMVADQEAVSRRMVDFCGLDWDDRCLQFHKTERVVQTSSVAQVRQPIYKSSVARWKKYQRHLVPLFRALGLPDTGPPEQS